MSGNVDKGVTRGMTALVYSRYIHVYIGGYIQEYRLGVPFPRVHHVHAEAGRTGLHRAPPELWCRLAGGKVRGSTNVVVTADGQGTAAVEMKMAPLVEGMQKFSPRPEKWFLDRRLVASEEEKV
jgi:hypothetical protein